MIGIPPVETPSLQVIPITRSLVTARLLSKSIGALGMVTTVAPFPGFDIADSPQTFEADTLAIIVSPSARL